MGVFNLFKKKKTEVDNKPTSRFIDDEWLEVSAGSKEEAIERACMALNTNPSHLEIKLLSKDGKKLQARKTDEQRAEAKAPARDRESQSRQPRSNQGRAQGQGRGGNRDRNEKSDRNPNARNARGQQARPSRGPAPQRQDRNQSRPQNMRDEEQTDETMMNDGEYRGGNDEYSYNHDRNTNEHYDDQQEQHSQANKARFQEEEDFVEEVEEETDLGRKAKEILLQIIQKIEANAKVELYETNKTIRLEIISTESGLFIGKFGQTLDSIQHLLKKILEIKFEDGKNLVVDAEDYRVRREESIESKARKLAKKARQEGRPVSVEPMNAMDRRIVHMALKGEPGIETKSVGEGSSRRVLIVPKRRASSGRNGGGRNEGGRGRGRGQGRGGFRGRDERPGTNLRDGNTRMHDSYDVPALPKSDVFGDNPEEYMESITKYDEEN